jgi:hypothetical protein
MSNVMPINPASESNDEQRLIAFGLSTTVLHNALTPGAGRARGRSAFALSTTPGTDIYHDTMEQLAFLLVPHGWTPVNVGGQPRLLHPDAVLSFTLASATNVANADHRKSPRAHGKGTATRNALAASPAQEIALFELPETARDAKLVAAAEAAPFWMLLHERTPVGLSLEFSRPSAMTLSGTVYEWADRIAVPHLDVDGDLSIFDADDNNDDDDGDFDVPVERL